MTSKASYPKNPENLTLARVLELVEYRPETGTFTWKVFRGGKARKGLPAGSLSHSGYVYIMLDRRLVLCHRLVWFIEHKAWPKAYLDHIDGDKLNNRIGNMREVSRAGNRQNLKVPQANNALQILGVYESAGKFIAHIGLDNKQQVLGYFDTPERAYQAYITAKRELHPTCTI